MKYLYIFSQQNGKINLHSITTLIKDHIIQNENLYVMLT